MPTTTTPVALTVDDWVLGATGKITVTLQNPKPEPVLYHIGASPPDVSVTEGFILEGMINGVPGERVVEGIDSANVYLRRTTPKEVTVMVGGS